MVWSETNSKTGESIFISGSGAVTYTSPTGEKTVIQEPTKTISKTSSGSSSIPKPGDSDFVGPTIPESQYETQLAQKITSNLEPYTINKQVTLQPNSYITVSYSKGVYQPDLVGPVQPDNILYTKKIKASEYETWAKKISGEGYNIYEIKQDDEDFIYRSPTHKQYLDVYQKSAKELYIDGGYKVPAYVKQQLSGNVPKSIQALGKPVVESFYRESYETSLGMQSMDKGIADLNKAIFKYSNEDWAKQYLSWTDPVTGKPTTWKQLKKTEPALYLSRGASSWETVISPSRWQQEEARKHKGDILWNIGQFLGETFASETIFEGVKQYQGGTGFATEKEIKQMINLNKIDLFRGGGYVQQARAKGHYEYYKTWQRGDILGGASRFIQSPFITLPVSFGIGAGFTATFKAIGGKAISLGYGTATATTSGKILGVTAKYTPKLLTGFAIGTTGYDIGFTAIFNREQLPKKLALYGLGFYGAGLGSRAVIMYKPKYKWGFENIVGHESVYVKNGKVVQAIGVRKYIDIFGKRHFYGKFYEYKSDTMTMQQYTDTIFKSQVRPYKPTGLAKPYRMGFEPVGKNLVYGTKWGNKVFMETGAGWQYKIPTALIVRPVNKPSIGLFDMPSMITESQAEMIPYISKKGWQPKTGLDIHPKEIKDLDVLFNVYRKGKISTSEYQSLRDSLKKTIGDIEQPQHPLAKPKLKVTPPVSKVKPIFMDVTDSGVVSTRWYGKEYFDMKPNWQQVIQNKLIVRPKYELMKPFRQFNLNYKMWQPLTGIGNHPSEITDLDELFQLYRSNKLTTSEYQYYRNLIRSSTKTTRGTTIIHPLAKPVFKPQPTPPYKVKPIRIEADKTGLIKSTWYGRDYFEVGKGWQGLKKGWLSTKVYPKPKLYRAYETYFRFIIIKKPSIIKMSLKSFTFKTKGKHFTLKDIVKKDIDITKEITRKGGKAVGGKSKTIILKKPEFKKPEIITVEEVKKDIDKISKGRKDITTFVRDTKITVPKELQKPISKPFKYEKPKLSPWFDTETDVISLIKPAIKETPIRITPIASVTVGPIFKQSFRTDIDVVPDLQKLYGFTPISRQVKMVEQRYAYKPVYKYNYKQQYNFYKEQTRVVPPVINIPPSEPVTPISKIKLPRIFIPDLTGEKKKPIDLNQGYDVLVKDRMYVKGKKKYEERFIKINKTPLNYYDAMGYGGTVVDQSAARSFKLRKSKKQPKKSDIPMDNWEMLQNKFYKRKQINIEKTIGAIDTIGEINEISALGWIAERRKMNKPVKIRKTKFKPIDLRQIKLYKPNVQIKSPEDFFK